MESKAKQWVLIIFSLFVSNTILYDKEATCTANTHGKVMCAVLGEVQSWENSVPVSLLEAPGHVLLCQY